MIPAWFWAVVRLCAMLVSGNNVATNKGTGVGEPCFGETADGHFATVSTANRVTTSHITLFLTCIDG